MLARSNHFLVARLPAAWVFWFALPHEVWHYLAARAVGLRARIVPGVTLHQPTSRWKSICVLLAPATVGLVWPLAWFPLLQGLSHYPGSVNWLLLTVLVQGWWAGCLGDFIDTWLLLSRKENKAQHRARMQHMLERYSPELCSDWQPAHD